MYANHDLIPVRWADEWYMIRGEAQGAPVSEQITEGFDG